jgi:hypothetical protein
VVIKTDNNFPLLALNIHPATRNARLIYSKTGLKWNLKGPEHFSAEARFPFNQGIP